LIDTIVTHKLIQYTIQYNIQRALLAERQSVASADIRRKGQVSIELEAIALE